MAPPLPFREGEGLPPLIPDAVPPAMLLPAPEGPIPPGGFPLPEAMAEGAAGPLLDPRD